jgi:hypothetical protein
MKRFSSLLLVCSMFFSYATSSLAACPEGGACGAKARCATATTVFMSFAAVAAIVTAIGWGTCGESPYCPDATFPYLYDTKTETDSYNCYTQPNGGGNSEPASYRHCSNYTAWWASFAGSMSVTVILAVGTAFAWRAVCNVPTPASPV